MRQAVIKIESLDEINMEEMIHINQQTEVSYFTVARWYLWSERYGIPDDCPLPTAWKLNRSRYIRRADVGKLEDTRMWLRGNPGAMREYNLNHTRGSKGEYRRERHEAKQILDKLIKGEDL